MNKELLHELFDYCDGKLFWKEKRNGVNLNNEAGYLASHGYWHIKVNNKIFKRHRIVFEMHNGYLPEFIDHINGIKNDDRIENLRKCNKTQNQYNSKLRLNNKSGLKGVCWHKRFKKWSVQITVNKKKHFIGYFDDLKLADLAAIEARNKYHKEFANHG